MFPQGAGHGQVRPSPTTEAGHRRPKLPLWWVPTSILYRLVFLLQQSYFSEPIAPSNVGKQEEVKKGDVVLLFQRGLWSLVQTGPCTGQKDGQSGSARSQVGWSHLGRRCQHRCVCLAPPQGRRHTGQARMNAAPIWAHLGLLRHNSEDPKIRPEVAQC